jgi:hypothetical protein
MAPRQKIELCDQLAILVESMSGDLHREAEAKVGNSSKYKDDARILIDRAQELVGWVDHMAEIDSEYSDEWYKIASDLYLLGCQMSKLVTSPISSLSEAAKKYSEMGTARSIVERKQTMKRWQKAVLDVAKRYKCDHGAYKVKDLIDHIIGLKIPGAEKSRGYLETYIAKCRKAGDL